MRTPVAIGTLILGATIAAGGQTLDQRTTGQLKRLFPDASAFSPREGSPPHFKAFTTDAQTGARSIEEVRTKSTWNGGSSAFGPVRDAVLHPAPEPPHALSLASRRFAALFDHLRGAIRRVPS